MQTIEEYKAYTQQLEGEVGKWHHAYDALIVERNQLVNHLKSTEKFLKDERSAREQDNHHYYKIFADGVKTLLEAL